MPELPDVTVYLEALQQRIAGARLERVQLLNPFLLRTAEPPVASVEGKPVRGLRRVGKRIVIELEGDLFVVVHLMIAGRLHWIDKGCGPRRDDVPALSHCSTGAMAVTEDGT